MNKACYKSLQNNSEIENNFEKSQEKIFLCSSDNKIWYTHYKSYIVKSWIHPESNRIIEEKIPYNHPSNYLKFLDNYNYSGKK